MSNADEVKSTPLQQAFREARRAAGKQAVHMVLVAHGAASGVLSDVPKAREAACLAALRKLANGGSVDTATQTEASFADIRKQAFGEKPRATPPKALDEKAIYDRWNNPPPVERG